MTMTNSAAAEARIESAATASIGRKPRDDEIDVWGVTHPGKVRATNEDHFLLG